VVLKIDQENLKTFLQHLLMMNRKKIFSLVLTLKKSTPSGPAISRGIFRSRGSTVPGSGMESPQKNSLDLKICMWRGMRSPKFFRIK